MEKRFLLVPFLFICLYNVQAQEGTTADTFLGMDISSLIVVLPIVMIIISLLFFVGLYLKDHSENISKSLKTKFRRKKLSAIKKRPMDYSKEVILLQKKIPAIENEEAINRLSNLSKKFFSEKLNINHEFTHGELEKELEKEKKSWAAFPKKLVNLRYSGEPVTKQEINALTKEFWNIVKYEKRTGLNLTVIEKLRKKRLSFELNILHNLKRYLQKAKPKKSEKVTSKDVIKYTIKKQKQNLQKITNIFNKVKKDSITEVNEQTKIIQKIKNYFSVKLTENKIDKLLDLMEDTQKQIIKGKINQAKHTYKQAYKLYYKIPIEEQVHIITELQKIQIQIQNHSKTKKEMGIIHSIKKYIIQKRNLQKTTQFDNLIKDTQKQIIKGKINQAKHTYKQIYKLYYKIPIEEQGWRLSQLKKINEQIINSEKSIERLHIEKLAEELDNLTSETDVYVILDKSNISKKIDFLKKYVQKISQQEIHGLKAGINHLSNKLKDLVKSAEKIIKEKNNKLDSKEKKVLTKIKDVGAFYTEKKEGIIKELKQKESFSQLHKFTKQIKIMFHPKTKKKVIIIPKKQRIHPISTSPKHIEKKEIELLKNLENILIYLKNKKNQGLYELKHTGKDFITKIEHISNNIKKKEQKGIKKLAHYEKEFFFYLTKILKQKEKSTNPLKEKKKMQQFLEHMKEEQMIQITPQKLQKEKLDIKPIIKIPKVNINMTQLKNLAKEEEIIMEKLQKIPKNDFIPTPKTQKKKLERFEWEVRVDEIRKKRTKRMDQLLKEEETILSKLNKL